MLAGQNSVIDRLVKILQAIQVERMTGSLMVTRGEGISYELGTLVFLNGRVVQGRVGRREGQEALNWLLTWGKCWYTFVRSITSDAAPRSKRQFSMRETGEQSRIPHVRLVPLGQAQRPRADWGESTTEIRLVRKPDRPTGWGESTTEIRLVRKPDRPTRKEGKTLLGRTGRVNETVPYVSGPLEDGLQVLAAKGLSRIHKRMFLLVNGSRRVEDLMRLLKLSEYETLKLLYDLQDTGIINLPGHLLL